MQREKIKKIGKHCKQLKFILCMIEALCCRKVCNWVLSASNCTLSNHSLSCVLLMWFQYMLVVAPLKQVIVLCFRWHTHWGMVTQISCARFSLGPLPKFHTPFTLCSLCKRSGICFELPIQMIRNAALLSIVLLKSMPF